MLYHIRNGLVAIPASIYLQPINCSLRQMVWNQLQTDSVQHKHVHVQSNLLSQSNQTMEHLASWCLPAAAWQFEGSTEHRPADVTVDRPRF